MGNHTVHDRSLPCTLASKCLKKLWYFCREAHKAAVHLKVELVIKHGVLKVRQIPRGRINVADKLADTAHFNCLRHAKHLYQHARDATLELTGARQLKNDGDVLSPVTLVSLRCHAW
ncbi:hypothetical protein, conserved [Leishmania tarentolae]|uniref:Uncharacterized protein n=1 Tax=Leishmania tarentolae TaxID=5689 RepID=A0A640KTL8_LEITA|nr:hypothetical protein, conserved [Leishmania tarentolae]